MAPKVLLAQKDTPDRTEAQAVLIAFGCDVTVTTSSAGAIDLVKKSSFDFVVLDVVLEDGDGYSVAKAIRSSELSPTACVVATGSFEPGEEKLCAEAGIDEVINLNCAPDEVTATLHKWMAKLVFKMYKTSGAPAVNLNHLSITS
jgi:CheY-like chemotaxis protein